MTPAALPLVDAQRRLGRPGRPKKTVTEAPGRPRKTLAEQAADAVAIGPRLLDLRGAAAYLSISVWTVRGLVDSGVLPRVRLAALRRVLVDRQDLDRLVSVSKDAAE